MRETNNNKIKPVDPKDQRDVIDFFTGAVSESAWIDTAKRAQTLVRKGGGDEHGNAGPEDPNGLRKREEKAERKINEKAIKAVAQGKELSVTDYIAMNEK